MATATTKTIHTPIVSTAFEVSKGVALELSESEAKTLRYLLTHIGGEGPRRDEVRAISAALTSAGFLCEPFSVPHVKTVGSINII